MKYTTAFAALAGLVAAQDFTGVPDCAVSCLREAIPQVDCSLTDTACQCQSDKRAQLLPLVQPCLFQNCDTAQIAQAASAAADLCSNLAASGTGSETAASQTATSDQTATGQQSIALPTDSSELSSVVDSITSALSSALSSALATDSESLSSSASVTTITSGGSTFTSTSTPTNTDAGASGTSSEGDSGAVMTAAPVAGMAIAAIIAAAL